MKIDSEEEAIFIAERKEWGGRSVSKLNRPIQLSAVGAGFTCPKTQSKPFSGERTSPLRTKRQHYPRFDTLRMHKAIILLSAPPDSGPNQIYPYE